jgi:hypothetical protein
VIGENTLASHPVTASFIFFQWYCNFLSDLQFFDYWSKCSKNYAKYRKLNFSWTGENFYTALSEFYPRKISLSLSKSLKILFRKKMLAYLFV